WVRRRKGTAWAAWTPAPAPALANCSAMARWSRPTPRLLWEDRYLTGPAAPGSRPSRQRDQQDCVAAALDALLIPAGQVGMIMAVFVPISGYKCSKNRRDGRI